MIPWWVAICWIILAGMLGFSAGLLWQGRPSGGSSAREAHHSDT